MIAADPELRERELTKMADGRKVQKWDQYDESLKSFAHMAVASLVGCSFCLDFGYFQAHNDGLDLIKAREVPRWRQSDVFTPLEREVMEYAEAMTQTTPTVTDEQSARPARGSRSGIAGGTHRLYRTGQLHDPRAQHAITFQRRFFFEVLSGLQRVTTEAWSDIESDQSFKNQNGRAAEHRGRTARTAA